MNAAKNAFVAKHLGFCLLKSNRKSSMLYLHGIASRQRSHRINGDSASYIDAAIWTYSDNVWNTFYYVLIRLNTVSNTSYYVLMRPMGKRNTSYYFLMRPRPSTIRPFTINHLQYVFLRPITSECRVQYVRNLCITGHIQDTTWRYIFWVAQIGAFKTPFGTLFSE